jgi:hypothetical protein
VGVDRNPEREASPKPRARADEWLTTAARLPPPRAPRADGCAGRSLAAKGARGVNDPRGIATRLDRSFRAPHINGRTDLALKGRVMTEL